MKPNLWLKLFLLLSFSLVALAFLEQPLDINSPEAGQCVWYGQCGPGWNQGKLNCPATPSNKKAPKMTDSEGLRILKSYCPSLYHGDDNTYTCCDASQLHTIENNIAIPLQIFAGCPACLYNFLNQICYLTCSPHQSKYMIANMTAPYPVENTGGNGIPSVTKVVTNAFSQDFFDSCKDVNVPGAEIKGLDIVCGRPAAQCTPVDWLQYMGNVNNGQAPFTIRYIVTDKPWVSPDGHTLEPLNISMAPCDKPLSISSPAIGTAKCKCAECSLQQPCKAAPRPTPESRKAYLDSLYGAGNYTTVELRVQRTGSAPWIQHDLPPPSVASMPFSPTLDKDFLKQVLFLQTYVSNIVASNHGSQVTFKDVCLTPAGQSSCVVESVLQYYQNQASNVDKQVMDQYGLFVEADYLDHFLQCTKAPLTDAAVAVLKIPCTSVYGGPIMPYMVLEGYPDTTYQNSTGLVITYVLRNTPGGDNSMVKAWENEFVKYMKHFTNPNMTVTYSPDQVVHRSLTFMVAKETTGNQGETPTVHSPAVPTMAILNPVKRKASVVIDGIDQTPEDAPSDPAYSVADNTNAQDTEEMADEGRCIWYGQCGTGWNQGKLNCPVTNKTRSPPLMTDKKGLQILQKYCPSLYHGYNNTRTCCDINQLTTFANSLQLPEQFLSRCPACYENFLNEICQMTCGTRQSDYLWANMSHPCPPLGCGGGIPSVTYVMTESYAEGLFNSCKDVQMPSANDKAISVFCGREASKCSPQIWLDYMGNTGNGKAPFPILYHFTDTPVQFGNDTLTPLNITNVRCNETSSNKTEACSCQDCQASCVPVPPPPPPKKPFKILGIDGPAFIMGCIFTAFVIFFGTYVICYNVVCLNSTNIRDSGSNKQNDDFDAECCEGMSVNGSQHELVKPRISPSDIGCFEKLGARLEEAMGKGFSVWGKFCAKYPVIVLLVTIIIFGSLSGGIARYDVTTDPVKLWSAKESTARKQKDYFDSHFEPFYRTEQIIISRPNNQTQVNHPFPPPSVNSINFSSLFDLDFMHQVLDLQDSVEAIQANYKGRNITLRDICFKPLAPDYEDCTIESVLQYWQNNRTNLDKVVMDDYGIFDEADHFDHFLKCVQAPASVSDTTKLNMSCLGAYGGPAFPWVVLGGYDGNNYQNATAFVITFVVNNHLDEEKNQMAEAWEAEFIKLMKNYSNTNMTVSFSSERSIQDELDRESTSDILTIVISYLIMFGYITITLGTFHSMDTILIDSKITLGLSGVTIVLLSVAASVGVYSYLNVPMTLIIIEVVPFLVLAVGVDNIFILVQTYQRDVRKPTETPEEQIGRILGTVGPSMLLTSFSESIAFFLGALTNMPAVRVFALYAALAVLFDFILQITCFVSLMTIDARRQETNRFDMCCCISLPKKEKQTKSEGYLYWLVKEYYSHALLTQWMRPIVILLFVGWFLASVAFACHVEIGLDQSLSMPLDSYVLDYFKNLTAYLSVGAPVYFVIPQGFNYLSQAGQNKVCGSKGCNQNSLIGQVFHASLLPNYTYIAQPASSWMDDYFDWINSGGDTPCCRVNATGGFCPSTSKQNCTPCDIHKMSNGRPTPQDFMKYLPMFLVDNPGLVCAKGGHPAYGAGVNLINNKTNVGASYFMTYHTPMKTSGDYIHGLKEARVIADNISLSMNITDPDLKVFPYSIFYVFYEQYLFIVNDTLMNVGVCIAAIFVVTFILLGFDIRTAIIVCVTIMMIVIDIMGLMYLWGIDLNALTLVNLVMAIGISVEFCSHIARAFAVSLEPNKILRAKDSLAHMGSSVLSGITLTKLGGIIVLAFAKSQLFQVFYFRMYLGMVVFGASHGLIFLPVLLSYVGPKINKAKLYKYQQEAGKETSRLSYTNNSSDSPSKAETPPPQYSHL